jgi:sulfatase maturation enzyme AslB (radical SAM superfamily)
MSDTQRIPVLWFGAGSMTRELQPALRADSVEVLAFIDERREMRGKTFCGTKIISLEEIANYHFSYILVGARPYEAIAEKLIRSGVDKEKIVSLDFEALLRERDESRAKAADVLTAHLRAFPGMERSFDLNALRGSPWLASLLPPSGDESGKRFCRVPFVNAWIEHDYAPEYSDLRAGDVNLCCWCLVEGRGTSATAGNISGAAFFEEIWNSERAQEFRASILDGSFRHCLKDVCTHLKYRKLPFAGNIADPKWRNIIDRQLTVAPAPEIIDLNYDESCNIACPQCRKKIHMARGDTLRRLQRVHEQVVAKLHNPARLAVTSGGDALASPIYLPFLQNFDETRFPDTKITLRTNGLLFTPEIWASLGKAHAHIDEIIISVDAATQNTYSQVRRPGNFAVLLKNLEFIKHIKMKYGAFRYTLSFCVQKRNFREMGDFVSLAENYGADNICFGHLTPNGDLVDDAFVEHAVHVESHPDHKEYKKCLHDRRLKKPSVTMACQ